MDYLHWQLQYKRRVTDGALTAGGTVTIVPKSSAHRLYIQKVSYGITTHANSKTIIAGDGTLVIGTINDLTAAAGVPDFVVQDFGPTGVALTTGATFTITSASSGPVAFVHIEAYERLITPVAAGPSNV